MTATRLEYETPPLAAPPAIIPRLSLMMFLEFAIQGAWLPLLFGFLHNHRGIDQSTVGNILAVGAVGAMLSPLIAGQIADRYMNAERVMALCHFIAAALVYRIAYATNPNELYVHSFLYGLFLTPTLALVNAISFRHLPDRERDFGKVRVWGTAGWVVAGITIGHWLLFKAGNDVALQYKYMADAMRLAAVLGVALGLYCFTLPPTPPTRVNGRDLPPAPGNAGTRTDDATREPRPLDYAPPTPRQKSAPLEALKEILRQPLLTLFLLSFIVASVHAFFFARAAEYLTSGPVKLPDASWINKIFGVGGGGLMTVGQMSELIVLACMPLIIPRVPRKVLFAIGLTAYALRFFAFAYLPYTWAIIPALALHGIVFGCFFFLVFITLDEYTTKDVRSSAQNVFNLIIFGFGVIIGNWLSGQLGKWSTRPDKTMDWQSFYAVPGYITLACLLALLIFYPNRPRVSEA
jgi:MFS family permease